MKQNAIIVDIDGTFAKTEYYAQDKYGVIDWDEVNEKAIAAPHFEWCSQMIESFVFFGYKILFVTGRNNSERTRKATETWLKKNCSAAAWNNSILFMRNTGDLRPDFIIKEEVLKSAIIPNFEVLFVLEDRSSVAKMYRENGITTLLCSEND